MIFDAAKLRDEKRPCNGISSDEGIGNFSDGDYLEYIICGNKLKNHISANKFNNVCEIKFSRKEFEITKEYDKNLRNKVWSFAEETHTKKAIHTTMLTTYGVKRNEYSGNIQSEVILDDLFTF